jgi:hypothetical protein
VKLKFQKQPVPQKAGECTDPDNYRESVELLPAETSVQAGILIAKRIGIMWFNTPMLCIGILGSGFYPEDSYK